MASKKGEEWQAEVLGHSGTWSFNLTALRLWTSSEKPFKKVLVQNVKRLLLAEVSELYTRVVARCLTGDIDNDGLAQNIVRKISEEQEPEHVFLDAYVNNIVEELAKCGV
jgi:hypothetical protein